MGNDSPDWQRPVDLVRQSLGNLTVEIAAQTVDTLGIDIQAQTVQDLGIDIQSQSLQEVNTAVQTERSKELKYPVKKRTDTVAANGGVETVTFTSPAGTKWETATVFLSTTPPDGASSGTHSLKVTLGDSEIPLLEGVSNRGSILEFAFNQWDNADVVQNPTDGAAQATTVKEVPIGSDTADRLEVIYLNDTDADQTNERTYALAVEETTIA